VQYFNFFINAIIRDEKIVALLIYLSIGAIAGFMAGLLGVGGGMIIVPGLMLGFTQLGLMENFSLHMALGTSLASIIFTSLASIKAHHKKRYVRWDIVKQIWPGLIIGTLLGTQIIAYLPAQPLQWVFILFLCLVAGQMLGEFPAKPNRQLPALPGMTLVGAGIGFISSFVGIGGGALATPFMQACNTPIREAMGTSAAIGLPIAVAGAAGNMLRGIGEANLPVGSVGFIYLPALCFIVLASLPMAKVGAQLAHHLPIAWLKKIFALMLIALAIHMFYMLC
jgi:uncharacterized membrane protein YfcA